MTVPDFVKRLFRLETLRARILVFAAMPVALLLTILIAFVIGALYTDLRDGSLRRINLATAQAAAEIERGNLEAITIARLMALAQENGLFGRRAESLRFARHILEAYPQFTGAYFGYEPDADGSDREWIRRQGTEGLGSCDASGRYLPYWFRDKKDPSLIRLTPLINMGSSFYYQGLKNRVLGKPETEGILLAGGVSAHYDRNCVNLLAPAQRALMITEPYEYEGKLIYEQTAPIMIDGRFAGISGVDRSLDQTAGFLQTLKPFRTCDFILISRRGRIVSATMDPRLNTKRIEETPYAGILLPFYRLATDADAFMAKDPVDTRDYFYDAAKVKTGGWTIVMRVSAEEVFAPLWSSLVRAIALSVAGLALTLGILVWLSGSVGRRVAAAARLAGRVSQGDLTAQVEVSGSDETGRLLLSVKTMVANLSALIGQVKASSIRLAETATRIAAASKVQEKTVIDFGSSTAEIAAAAREISSTAGELAGTVDEVALLVGQAAALAESGRTSLGGMEEAMRTLSGASDAIGGKLSVIREKADNISGVVVAITKVADQTNLLSLNAAIEAEKAGKYGLGFSVVASEIRRLADQTAVATLDIERMVRDMQAAVAEGVAEMGRFATQVRLGVAAAGDTGERLGRIIEKVQSLTPRFEAVNVGMRAQSDGAQQISSAMLHLKDAARTTSDSVCEFDRSTAELEDTVRTLRDELSRFQTGD